MPIEAIADPAREPEPEKVVQKVPEQPKMMVTALPKLSATTGTPRKRRMASVLEVVLESVKMTPPSSAEASASSSAHAKARLSEIAPESCGREPSRETVSTYS
jgi:hypothetical protein